jgi:hypothetical protein
MAYTTIDDPSAYFQTALYTGNSGDNAITNDGNSDLQPDWIWIKNRGAAQDHVVFDSSRGFNGDNDSLYLETNNSDAESHNDNDHLKSFNSDGFTMQGGSGRSNNNTVNFVAWQWKANGGTTTSNGASGDIKASVTQREDTAKFAICTYTGTGINAGQSHRVNHGLGTTPHLMLFKNRGAGSTDWVVYHHKNTAAPETDYLVLNSTAATADSANKFNDTAPNTSYATIGGDDNISSNTMVLYSFAEVQGYSKFGSYTGNGNANGPFVYTGFKPAFLIIKNTSDGDDQWIVWDNKRSTFNPVDDYLAPSANDAESANSNWAIIDFVSNGFKVRSSDISYNQNTYSYIYIAFAEHPFVSSEGVPVTAR